jgi:peroxiredoxin
LRREYESLDAVIIGCSFDNPEANRKFAQLYAFDFSILSDTRRLIGMAYGAARNPDDQFARRIAYVIGPDGRIVEAHADVSARAYPREQLERLRSAKAALEEAQQASDPLPE